MYNAGNGHFSCFCIRSKKEVNLNKQVKNVLRLYLFKWKWMKQMQNIKLHALQNMKHKTDFLKKVILYLKASLQNPA